MDDLSRGRGFEISPHYLRSFYYAALFKSFTRAADKMWFCGQPVVSQHIRCLEAKLGKLFIREARGVELTPKGQALFELAAPIVEALEKLKADLDRRCAETPYTRVIIAWTSRLQLDFLAKVFPTFREQNPSVEVVVLEGVNPHRVVASGTADFGLVGLSRKWPELQYEELMTDRLVLITPLGHPLAACRSQELLKEICNYPYVRNTRSAPTQRIVEDIFHRHGLALEAALEAAGWQDVKNAVSLNMGISIVPNILLWAGHSDVEVIPLSDEFPPLPWGIGVRRGASLSAPARDLMARVTAAIRGLSHSANVAEPRGR